MASQRILVVDDDPAAGESLAAVLTTRGVDTLLATSGTRALETALQWIPDAVLLDFDLPDIDGSELARRLRQHQATSSALLVAVTGHARSDDRHRALAAGCDHFVVKPADIPQLCALLANGGR